MRHFSAPLVALALLMAAGAHAAPFRDGTYDELRAKAERLGAVSVNVTLLLPVPPPPAGDDAGRPARLQRAAQVVKDELGQSLLPTRPTVSTMGVMAAWVTGEGLALLQRSVLARHVAPGPAWDHRARLFDGDFAVRAVTALLRSSDVVDVEITLSVDGVELDVDARTGQGSLRLTTPALQRQAREAAQALLADLGVTAGGCTGAYRLCSMETPDMQAVERTGVLTLRANEPALADLVAHPAVRAIKPPGYRDTGGLILHPWVLEEAARSSQMEVTVLLRTPYQGGALSAASRAATARSRQRILEEVLAPVRPLSPVTVHGLLGTAHLLLGSRDVERLVASGDQRVLNIVANRPIGGH